MNIIKKSLSNIDVSDIFFDSLRNDYPNFNEWFLRDCSRKTKAGKHNKAIKGKVMATYTKYRI